YQLISDDPYYLYINHDLVKSQGVRPALNWADPEWNSPRTYAQEELEDINGHIKIRKGPNHITIVLFLGENSAGATILMPALGSKDIKIARGKDPVAMPGWNVSGPLNTPFTYIADPLNLKTVPSDSFYNGPLSDVASSLLSYEFKIEDEPDAPIDNFDMTQGQFAIIEFEEYRRGCPVLELEGKNGDIIDLIYGDVLNSDGVLSPYIDGARKIYSITLSGGTNTWEALNPHGMKYLMIYCRVATKQVTINSIAIRTQVVSFRERASFSCSDELLNQIWETSFRTLRATYDGVFLNAGGRQGYQYLGDAMIQSLASFFVFGTAELSEKALREFAYAQYETGEIPAIVPSDYNVRMLDFSLLWPVWLQRHIMFSGDMEFLEEMLPHLERLLVFFETEAGKNKVLLGNSSEAVENDCLLDYDRNIDKTGISTGLNAIYCYSLLKSEWLFSIAKQTDSASYCNQVASEIAMRIRDLCWDEEKGLFADSWCNNELSKSATLQSNVLALQSGIATPEQSKQVFSNIFIEYAPFQETELDREFENPYFKFFLLDMAFSMGNRDWATDYMRYYWGRMVQSGAETWWQYFSPDMEFDTSLSPSTCHGYACSPNYFLINEILGVRPATPGYNQIYFNPQLSAVEWITAQIPTPQGNIKIDWRYTDEGVLEVSIDANYRLEVLPQLDTPMELDTVLKVGENVQVLSDKEKDGTEPDDEDDEESGDDAESSTETPNESETEEKV
ncbi:MAG: hypothetical protein HRT89_16865, partial [Lentisphaeria bacterium]|nr:hypothetical protein [Lentisphaeria bacterium]NQZ69733.1 hypothetical protein [Lentisphaeria bacterium]